jgi:hypothetical protein
VTLAEVLAAHHRAEAALHIQTAREIESAPDGKPAPVLPADPVTPQEPVPTPPAQPTPPAPVSGVSGAITGIVVHPNDSSALVVFDAVPGATDYRLRSVDGRVTKYAGQMVEYSAQSDVPQWKYRRPGIEWNGLGHHGEETQVVIEAVAGGLGPFQDPAQFAAMESHADCECVLNGHGGPNEPLKVIAASAPLTLTAKPRVLFGEQAFFDTFNHAAPLVKTGRNPGHRESHFQSYGEYIEWQNDRWTMAAYGADPERTHVFFHDGHFMDVLADNLGNADASLVMTPRQSFDFKGKVLHVTFEVDAHMTGRRWINLLVAPAGDPVTTPGLLKPFAEDPAKASPTKGRTSLLWEIQQETHRLKLFTGGRAVDVLAGYPPLWSDHPAATRSWWDKTPTANGTMQDVDRRHRFDLYLGKNRVTIEERDGQGRLWNQVDRPLDRPLPFDRADVHLIHQVYHTALEAQEQLNVYADMRRKVAEGEMEQAEYDRQFANRSRYYTDHMPKRDERHWDNCGAEVLTAWPRLEAFPLRTSAADYADWGL